jgi:hypothetical protein
VEEILDATVQYVLSKEGEYDENPVDWHYLNVRETGYEISQWDAEYQREELDKKKQGDVVPKYEIHNYRGPRP